MWLLGLSLRSFARSLRSATGLRPGPLAALGVAVLALCAAATALSVSSVLSLDLMLLDPAMQRDLIGALGRAAFLAGGVLGLFLALITVPGEGMRLVMRQNRGSAVDLYLLMYGARDVLTPVIGLVLSAVAWVPAAYLLGDQGSAAAATALAALGSRATALGGLLFLASDTLLALRLFLPGADAVIGDVAVMSTYGLGQGLLAAGTVALLRARRPHALADSDAITDAPRETSGAA